MSHKLGLPHKKENPRTIRGARRKGWHIVESGKSVFKDDQCVASWTGLNIWAELNSSGYWVSSYSLGQFAFEREEDASMFIVKWQW